MIKVMFYLYSVYPDRCTKTHIASHGRFDPRTIQYHIELAYLKGYLIKEDRFHRWGNKYIGHDAYRLSIAGERYIDELLESVNIEVTV